MSKFVPGDIVMLRRGMEGASFLAIEDGRVLPSYNSRVTLIKDIYLSSG